MPLRFFNTYSRQLENFESRDAGSRKIDIYTCGPTVYSRAHIGNFRAYIFEDLLQRHLELRGYKVHRVMNITDVDDKTIRGAREAKVELSKFTEPFKQAFFEDIDTLRIKRADEFPAATDQRYIDKMIEMIGALITRELAYQAEDKSVYYRINKFPNYGKLSHIDLTQLQSTGRVKNDEYDKEHIGDFALWKAWDENDGDVRWDSPWGPGRPGWHIECSAMATAILGDQIDIHCGGVDNIFPHHEAEIAQTEGVTGKQFVCYWLHCAHLLVDGAKMSKSLGNFYTLPDMTAKGYSGREIRYALMRVHYRTQLNFTWEGMEESRQALARIDDWLERLRETAAGKIDNGAGGSRATSTGKPVRIDEPGHESINQPGEEFEKALDDDLNISAALGFLFDSIREINRALDQNKLGTAAAKAWLDWWERINRVLAIEPEAASLPADVAALAEARMQARLAKDWRKSDELRDELSARGWEARDTKDGQKVTRRAGA
ncbi:MAG: cysteinyl-tRNA synthetase [Verrucomicrobiota bacterium]